MQNIPETRYPDFFNVFQWGTEIRLFALCTPQVHPGGNEMSIPGSIEADDPVGGAVQDVVDHCQHF